MTGRALVTGATGMLGSYIAQCLREAGWCVRALVRSRDRQPWLEGIGAERVDGFLEDVNSLTAAARSCDVVFHAAAFKHVPLMEHNPCNLKDQKT